MTLDEIREHCLSLPGATEDVKWGNDLVFSICEKMFAVTCLDCDVQSLSFKASNERFEELSIKENYQPAPYLARAKWILIEDTSKEKNADISEFVKTSYTLVRAKLSKKLQQHLPPLS